MQTETATLLAVMATPIAVIALITAVACALLARRGRRAMGRATANLATVGGKLRSRLAATRAAAEQLGNAVNGQRVRGHAQDRDVVAWTASLTAYRTSMERVGRSRLGPAVRAMHVAGALARVALMWRTPAR